MTAPPGASRAQCLLIVEDASTDDIISWTPAGTSFVVWKPVSASHVFGFSYSYPESFQQEEQHVRAPAPRLPAGRRARSRAGDPLLAPAPRRWSPAGERGSGALV